MRYRLGAVFGTVALVVATLGIPSASALGPTLTRVRVVLWGTGEWQSVTFGDSMIGAMNVDAVTQGAAVERGFNNVVLKSPGGTASTAVTVLLEVASKSTYTMALAKSKAGEAHVTVDRINTTTAVRFLSADNYQTDGDCVIEKDVARVNYVGEGYTMPKVDPARRVLAFYYPWYNGDFDFSGMKWYDRPTGPYLTDDAVSVQKMVDQAADAGIDGFVLSWDGKHEPQLDRLLEAAHNRGNFSVAVTLSLLDWFNGSTFDINGIVAGAQLALSKAGDSAFLRVGGRPVMFVWGAYDMGQAAWLALKPKIMAAGADPFLVGQPIPDSWGFDGSYTYNPNGYNESYLGSNYRSSMRALRYQAQVSPTARQRLWAAAVSPGQNLSYSQPLFPQAEPRDDGQRYNLTWNVAVSTDPEWIVITSWNEWYEATHISPSEKFGHEALDITRNRAAWFHNPQPTAPASNNGGLLPILPLKLGPK